MQAPRCYLNRGICVYLGTLGDGAFFCMVSICTLGEYAPCGFLITLNLVVRFSTADPFELLGTDLAYVEVGCCIISRMLLLLNLLGLIWPSWSLDFAGW